MWLWQILKEKSRLSSTACLSVFRVGRSTSSAGPPLDGMSLGSSQDARRPSTTRRNTALNLPFVHIPHSALGQADIYDFSCSVPSLLDDGSTLSFLHSTMTEIFSCECSISS